MQFKCANCGGNVVYDPSDGHMKCMSCQSVDTEEVVTQEDSYSCPSCGAKLEVNDFTSAIPHIPNLTKMRILRRLSDH